MQEQTLAISGMHCASCEKTITRALEQIGVRVLSINYVTESAKVQFDPDRNSFSSIEKAISDVGYELNQKKQTRNHPEEDAPGFLSRYKAAVREYRENRSSYAVERSIITSSFGTLLVVAVLLYLLYFLLFWNVENFLKSYGQYMAYLSIAVVASGAAVKQLRAYRASVSCMSGMMIGMTVGMISSMLIGIVLGSTNGMFTGAIYSMVIGMGVGGWAGARCGIMGVMEGMMAGLMGGTMGPMISVMMISDKINIFMPIFFVACLLILVGLMYMVRKEFKSKQVVVKPYPFWTFSLVNFAIVAVGVVLMVWGPRAAFLIK